MHGALFVQTISTLLMYGTMMPGSMLIHLIIDFVTTISFSIKGTVSRYIDKNRTGACGLGRNRRLLRHTELVSLSTVCARRVVWFCLCAYQYYAPLPPLRD